MTKLSLLLYATDVLDSISNVCIAFGIIAVFIFAIFGTMNIALLLTDSSDNDECAQWCQARFKLSFIIPVIAIFFFFSVSALIPEKKTMYMIIGVEMADTFRQTDTAKELSNEMKGVLTDITGIIHSYAHEMGANTQKEAK